VDYMCAYGPIVLGYQHEEVEAAVDRQRKDGDCFNHPTQLSVTLAEALCERVAMADWAVFGKNGGDMTSWAIRVAREHTGRKGILKVKGAYHGVDAWCAQQPGGVIAEDVAHVHDFRWNDVQGFQDLLKRYRNKVAGILVTPFHHPSFADCVNPEPEFVQAINQACAREGIVLIVDDIRAGFRLNTCGSHVLYGWEPSLVCFCKALGNGYPISATVGADALKVAASKVFLTGSYWNGAISMAAALKVIEVLERDHLCEQIQRVGERLKTGLLALGERLGEPIVASGPPAAPFYRLKNETNFLKQQAWCKAAIAHTPGAFFHPHHNWFLSAAHTEADIDQTLQIAEVALKAVLQAH
jgi:glutamate-1-semialdehyde 2,1-aminomutase